MFGFPCAFDAELSFWPKQLNETGLMFLFYDGCVFAPIQESSSSLCGKWTETVLAAVPS